MNIENCMCWTGNVYHNTFINGLTETGTLKYIDWCFYVGVPMQPTLVFTVLLAKKGHSRPGYNARPYAQSRTDVST